MKKTDSEQRDYSDCTFAFPSHIPRQQNGDDCGVFVCEYARRLSNPCTFGVSLDELGVTKNGVFEFTQADIPRIRQQMHDEIIGEDQNSE
jgi:Ulp1 family protease